MGDDRIFLGGPNGQFEGVFRWLHANYKHRLHDKEDLRLYVFFLPDELRYRLSELWPDRYLGPALPPSAKLDGLHPAILASKRAVGPQCDGAWDFSADFGLILFNLAGLLDGDGDLNRPVSCILAGRDSEAKGFSAYLDRLARRYAQRHRTIVALGRSTLQASKVRVDPAQVVLPPGVRESLIRDATGFISGKRWYAQRGIPWKRATLLYGPPGTGKTLVATMLASLFLDRHKPVYAMTFDRRTEFSDVHHAFSLASSEAPAMLIFEDLEAIQTSMVSRSAFLNLIDGANSSIREGVFVVATSNHPEQIDGALLGRPGRWDRGVEIALPTADARRQLLQRMWGDGPYAPLIPLAVRESDGLNMASLREIHYQVAMLERDGMMATENDIHRIIRDLKRVEKAKETGRWDTSHERVVGFAPASSAQWDGADATAHGDD